jgi:hypothetical protein
MKDLSLRPGWRSRIITPKMGYGEIRDFCVAAVFLALFSQQQETIS